MGLVADYLLKKFVQWAENKIKENPLYLKCTGHITIAASNNTELNCFLEEAIKNAKTNSLIAELQDEDLIRSIDQNIDIISNCIVRTRHQLPFDNFLMGITYE